MRQRNTSFVFIVAMLIAFSVSFPSKLIMGQSATEWYNSAQERIDTLRKGDFGIKIVDDNGDPYTGDVSVRLKKHEFPFGMAFDFYESSILGSTYVTEDDITADADAEIYKSERYNDSLEYHIPVENSNECKVTLKFAETYQEEANKRLFDVSIDGEMVLDDYNVFSEAGGKNIAKDTSFNLASVSNVITIKLVSSLDNAAIKGIAIEQVSGTTVKINCGGKAMTTTDGNIYESEDAYLGEKVQTVATKEQWMQAAMYKYFNYGVSGNSFKWSGIQPRHTEPDYTDFDRAVRWAQKVGWDMRAHTLLWGAEGDHEMPAWVKELDTPEMVYDTCKMRVQREVARYKGIIKEYDVINEPLTGHADSLANNIGESINWDAFKWAREVDPDAELYINDYNVELNWGQAEEYRDLVLEILENGGPVTGIGIQSHFWDCCRPKVDELLKNFNILAETGLPLRLTEYDWGSNLTPEQEVDDFMKVATVAFSHPAVNGMICWGLCDADDPWRENSGFFDSVRRPKLAADTLLYLTKTKWATNFDDEITDASALEFNAYYGDYEIIINVDGAEKILTVPCLEENVDSVFVLKISDAVVKGPQLVGVELDAEDVVKMSFDKDIDGSTIVKSDFKFFSNYEIEVNDIQFDANTPKELFMVLNTEVTKGDYISVSYFPGTLMGANKGIVQAFGPEGIQNEDETTDTTSVSTGLKKDIKLYPNPANTIVTIENDVDNFELAVINGLGQVVYTSYSQSKVFAMDISEFKNGIYFVKVTDADNNVSIMKLVKH